jgi:hypothetical protein
MHRFLAHGRTCDVVRNSINQFALSQMRVRLSIMPRRNLLLQSELCGLSLVTLEAPNARAHGERLPQSRRTLSRRDERSVAHQQDG